MESARALANFALFSTSLLWRLAKLAVAVVIELLLKILSLMLAFYSRFIVGIAAIDSLLTIERFLSLSIKSCYS